MLVLIDYDLEQELYCLVEGEIRNMRRLVSGDYRYPLAWVWMVCICISVTGGFLFGNFLRIVLHLPVCYG